MLSLKESLGEWYSVLSPLLLQSEHGFIIGQWLSHYKDQLEPKLENVFRAYKLTPPRNVKVIILGQDPYPGGHADGLAFSSGIGHIPYSLQNIFKSMEDQGMIRTEGSLQDWAEQGVFLLNTSLTTIRGEVGKHKGIGWQKVILITLNYLMANYHTPLVMIGWGTEAQGILKSLLIDGRTVLSLYGNHPAATKHGYIFRGGEHFIKANEFLVEHGTTPIKWGD
jgi:uracil-DNA glycosylase